MKQKISIKMIGRNKMIYQTDRMLLRPFNPKTDCNDKYYRWINDPEINKYTSHAIFPLYPWKAEAYFADAKTYPSTQIIWSMIGNDHRNCIGNVTLTSINYLDRSAELALIICLKFYWGKGYATEACQLVLTHGFKKMNLHRIYLGTAEPNIAMQHVAQKIGMKREGTFREALFLEGKYEHSIHYAILVHEWKEWQKEKQSG